MVHIFSQHPLQRDPVSGQMAGSHTDKFHQTRRASTAIQFNNPRSAIATSQSLGNSPAPPTWAMSHSPQQQQQDPGATSPRSKTPVATGGNMQQGQGRKPLAAQGQGSSPRKYPSPTRGRQPVCY